MRRPSLNRPVTSLPAPEMNLLPFILVSLTLFLPSNGYKLIEFEEELTTNDSPIIGILTQELSAFLAGLYPSTYKSFIAASYIKFVEGSGARAVPIWIGQDDSYYEDLMSKINGVLFPGGSSWFENPNGYADAGDKIYKIAKKINDAGEYFPLWGTCLGFELLTYLSANRREHRASCDSNLQPLPLNFKTGFKESKMFKDAPFSVISVLSQESVTSNFHSYCVTEANVTKFGLDNEWDIISVNDDLNGFNFISALESKNYPFYGVQFHPEKNIYEWVLNKNIVHSKHAVQANRYFGDFFIGEARKNQHKFNGKDEENKALIYNYQPTFTGVNGSAFQQCYLFE